MIFDRKWFNRLYFTWLNDVYEKNPDLAQELDIAIIGGLGKRMAKEIKKQIPKNPNTMDYLLNALKESHWSQENVEVVGKSNNEMILQTRDCSFQLSWKKKHKGQPFYCTDSHKAFLEEFCKEFDPNIKIENLFRLKKSIYPWSSDSDYETPEDGVYCKWKISKTDTHERKRVKGET